MNDYNFDYMNYMTNIPSTNKMNLNYIPNNNSNPPKMLNQNSYNYNQILDPKEGFIKGNLFNNLYDRYKNYTPKNINPQNEREALLNQWQQYNFATIDLKLYLDTHPNDTNTLKLYNKYNNILKEITEKYEKQYGPLTSNGVNSNSNTWTWIKSPWPWEGDANV